MELVKITLDKKNLDTAYLILNEEHKNALVEFEYKDVLYIANLDDLTFEQKEEFLTNYNLLEKNPSNWSDSDWVNQLFIENWKDYTDQILLEYPEIWELDEERMWNEDNTLALAENTIQFKKPFELFAGLAEGSEIDIFTDGQNTMASPKDNPSLWIADIFVDIEKYIESSSKTTEITELNQFEFIGRGTDTHVYFYFEGMTVTFQKEENIMDIVNREYTENLKEYFSDTFEKESYKNNCAICSDFVSDKDLYCSACTQIED